MADAVHSAIASERHVVVQAGTGTGKTLGYLVPVVMSGRRTIITTATKALQDQLADKDLPLVERTVARTLGRDLTWAVLKGRQNYVCRQRVDEIVRSTRDEQLHLPDSSTATSKAKRPSRSRSTLKDEVKRIASWAEGHDTGDLAALPFTIGRDVETAVTVGADECPGARRCPFGASCFAEIARLKASDVDVVVVNTHLYGLDVAADGAILGDHEVVVIDEAHGLEDIISDSVAISFSSARYQRLTGALTRIIDDVALTSNLSELGNELQRRLLDRADKRLPVPLPADLIDLLLDSRRVVGDALEALRAARTDDEDANQRKLRAQQISTRFADELDLALRIDESFVPFVSGSDANLRLDIAPLDIGPVLATAAWAKRTAVLTSATIPANLPGRIGLPDDTFDVVDVGSPFDYPNNALLYCPSHFPNPNSDRFATALHDELYRLIRAAGGRTLALFTSYRALDAAVDALRPILDVPVVSQRDLTQKNKLVEAFAADEESCLFATAGFFQGIDVPGRTLSLVTIDRIPFPRPDDPLLSARRERLGDRAFHDIDLPRAATALAQAAGRLIRSTTDRGVVTVFDPRLATAGYRRHVLAAMPPMKRTVDRDEVETFLRRIAES